MTDKEIQALTLRYLDGLTTPEEEQLLASPSVLPRLDKALQLMLGPLAQGEAEYDAIMASRQRPTAQRRWLWAAAWAAAASVVLAVFLLWPGEASQPLPIVHAAHYAQALQPSAPSPAPVPVVQEPQPAPPPPAVRPKARKRKLTKPARELPDTLGQGIWQDEENVLLALQMLEDCEKTIERSEQRLRNDVVEATFTALPQRPQTRLVVYDNGDYMVVDDSQPTIIEL